MTERDELLEEGPAAREPGRRSGSRDARIGRIILVVLLVAVLAGGTFIALHGYALPLLVLGVIVVVGAGLHSNITRGAQRKPASPLRGLIVVLTAVTLATIVLAALSGFQDGDLDIPLALGGVTVAVAIADSFLQSA
jgi:hypothetical protein